MLHLKRMSLKLLKLSRVGIAELFFILFVFFVPFGISTLLYVPDIYSSGFFNPYLSFSLYLSDIFFLFSLLFWGSDIFAIFRCKRFSRFFWVFLAFLALSLLFSSLFLSSMFILLRFLQFLVVFLLLGSKLVDLTRILQVFISALLIVALIAVLQFILQHSLGLHFLGEPLLSSSSLSVAKFSFAGEIYIRSYGTFDHPNILAAFMIVGIALLLGRNLGIRKSVHYFLVFLFSLALIFTFSRSVLLALIPIVYLSSSSKNKGLALSFLVTALFFLSAFLLVRSGVLERLVLLDVSWRMFLDNLFGVGLGNFTFVMQDYTAFTLQPWEHQPVHNSLDPPWCVPVNIIHRACLRLPRPVLAHRSNPRAECPLAP